MPRITTRGAASALAFGELNALGQVAEYVESVFSTYLYTGTTAVQSITNGVNLSVYGGMVWMKDRSFPYNNCVVDSARGLTNANILYTNTTSPNQTNAYAGISSFNTTGFTLRSDQDGYGTNYGGNVSPENYVSWTFRKQPKFFDVVTYTGNGDYSQQVNHLLGSIPGAILMKCTSLGGTNWVFACRRNDTTYDVMYLNTTGSSVSGVFRGGVYGNATQFGPGWFANVVAMNDVNANGATYVAYLFAHNAGGFGLTGTDNVISCGSFTADGSGNASVTLGYEPQWLLIKSAGSTESWYVLDNMRGLVASPGTTSALLIPNSSTAESTWGSVMQPTATGFTTTSLAANTLYIYIAIRRGPMKVPETGTSVFAPLTRNGTGTAATLNGNAFPIDMAFITNRDRVASTVNGYWDRLRGSGVFLNSNSTNAEGSNTGVNGFDVQDGLRLAGSLMTNGNSYPYVNHFFRRAPGFFDEVCYTGTGVNPTTITHNLGVSPELIFVKRRSGIDDWSVWASSQSGKGAFLNTNDPFSSAYVRLGTTVSSTTFSLDSTLSIVNASGSTYVAYLFASCPGVSKVTNFTGTGSLQTINCGFTSGARWVLVKRTDAAGDWYVWDSARGISSSNDPYLLLNSTAAEVTTTNWVDTTSTGFQVTAAAGNNVNINGASYIALAIA